MAELDVPDIQDLNLEALVRGKIGFAQAVLRDTPFFVEHTGLIIDAWKGLPGGLTKCFVQTVGSAGLCRMLQAYTGRERTARVKTVIGFSFEGAVQVFEGSVIGSIATEPRGATGFGWDNIFVPAGETQTYAEMGQERKNLISMRQRAAAEFSAYLALHFGAG